METTGRSWTFSFTGFTLGTSTCKPNSITCAVSMKMISTTSHTSTSGTMLISAMAGEPRNRPRPSPLELFIENAMLSLQTALGQVQELELKVFHARGEFLNGAAKDVVENIRGNGGEQADGGGDQRFGDTGRHRPQTGRAGRAQLLECVDNAPDRPEQTDEWRDPRRGCENAHVALQARQLFAHAELQSTLQGQRIRDTAA